MLGFVSPNMQSIIILMVVTSICYILLKKNKTATFLPEIPHSYFLT